MSSSISRLPAVFQPENCALIQNFEVSVCRATKEHADTAFPMMLNVICTQLPCLTKFTVYEYRYENNITTDVERAIYQPMIRLLSFAVYRESPLNRMILPADSGPAFGEEHWRCKFYLVAEKGCGRRDWKSCTRWTDASKSKPKTYEVRSARIFQNVTVLTPKRTKFSTQQLRVIASMLSSLLPQSRT